MSEPPSKTGWFKVRHGDLTTIIRELGTCAPSAFVLWGVLSAEANLAESLSLTQSIRALSHKTGLSDRTVTRCLRELQGLGLLKIQHNTIEATKGRTLSTYTLVIPGDFISPRGDIKSEGREAVSPRGDKQQALPWPRYSVKTLKTTARKEKPLSQGQQVFQLSKDIEELEEKLETAKANRVWGIATVQDVLDLQTALDAKRAQLKEARDA